MQNNIVNFWCIWAVFSVLIEAEASDGPLNLDANDEYCMKRAYRRYLLPYVQCMDAPHAEKLRRTFIYFLNADHFPVDEILGSTPDLTMNEPNNPRALFEWLWEVMYPGIAWHGLVVDSAIVDNDITRVDSIGAVRGDDV